MRYMMLLAVLFYASGTLADGPKTAQQKDWTDGYQYGENAQEAPSQQGAEPKH